MTRGEPMYGLDDRPNRLCDGQTRREWLRVGGLSVLGLGLGELLQAGSGANPAHAAPPDPSLVQRTGGCDLRPGQECHLPLAARRTAAARDLRPQARCARRDPRPVPPDRDQRARHPLLRAPAADRAPGGQAGRRPVDRHRRPQSRRQRLLGADRLSLRPGQCPPDQAERLALLRLDRQDAQAERIDAGADLGLGPRRDAAERQRHPRRPDGGVPGQALGARALRRRPRRTGLSHRGPGPAGRAPAAARGPAPRAARPARRLFPRRGAAAAPSRPGSRFARDAYDLVSSGRARAAFDLRPASPMRSATATAATPGARRCCWPAD